MSTQKSGVLFALSAYGIWGFLVIYFKVLKHVPAQEILIHRIFWSIIFTGLLLVAFKNLNGLRTILHTPQKLMTLLLSSALIATNWLIFIWAIQHDRMLDASLGYYINPLVNILLGLVFLQEKLRRLQWFAVALAFSGVAIQLIAFGKLPWISLALAMSFGVYGLIRKQVQIDAQTGLFVETLILLLPAIIYVFWNDHNETFNMLNNSWQLNIWLILAGPFTSIPLILFAAGAKRLNYSTMGFFQYIAPSVMFLLAVFVFGEVFTLSKGVTFGFIWTALFIFSYDGIHQHRQQRRKLAPV
ncbi:EamA family transporter RarD [Gynuella sunshinyii]|uniref:Putative permease n=1 Tax=Gynuella sunshinyii YC6258 TaxID=1445510 RepID=A0A0C5VAM9_9GAMM|nr:EamA family transporter RarD [Gynuella sunshinyii]AJQ96390.1 putative permease [Gynuella sunshinyii YC6258]